MKAIVPLFSIMASVATVIATLVRLRWHHAKEAPGPTPRQSEGQKALRVAAAVWLIAVAVIGTLLVVVLVMPAIVRLFV